MKRNFLWMVLTVIARVNAAGAKIDEQLHETVYGELQYDLEAPEGYRWLIASHALYVDPSEWGAALIKPLE